MLLSLLHLNIRLLVAFLLLASSNCAGNSVRLQSSPQQEPLENYLQNADAKAVAEAVHQGSKSLTLLRRYSTSTDFRIRQLIMRCVGSIGDNQAADILALGLTDNNINVRLAAADELATKPYPGAAEAILSQLQKSPELIIQEKLALAAGRLSAEKSLSVLKSMSGSADQLGSNVRMALARLGEPKARNAFIQALGNKLPLKRYEALEQLVYVDDARLLLSAKKLLLDKTNALRIGSLRASRYRRVCDQAVDTFVAVLKLVVDFPVDPERNYSAQELNRIKGLVK